jgi:hypothetical protein
MTRARTIRSAALGVAGASLALAVVVFAARAPQTAAQRIVPADALGADLDHWRRFLDTDTVSVGFLADVKASVRPALAAAEGARAKGRRHFAMLRLGAVRNNLEPGIYAAPRAMQSQQQFEAEWHALAARFADARQRLPDYPGVRPAIARAFAQATTATAKESYDASLAYGQAT